MQDEPKGRDEMQELWNEICFIVDRYRQSQSDESVFQIEAENIFEKLGWSRFKGEISSQQRINVGSARTVRPDIVVSNGQENLYVIELKKPSTSFADRNADQLISYMRLLRLTCGILLGDSIRVFYDTPDNQNDPVEIIDIPLESGNTDGAKLLDVIKHADFSQQRLADYCENRMRLIDARRNADELARMLCSSKGNDFITSAVRAAIVEANSEEIANLVIGELTFSARRKSDPAIVRSPVPATRSPAIPTQASHKRERYKKYQWDPNEKVDALELHPREGESFQDYVRRTMQLAFSNHMLTDEDIRLLQDLSYSKRTFGLGYPVLVEGSENVYDRSGRRRYWKDPIYRNYYCCNDWWKDKIPMHQKLFTKWVEAINERALQS